MNTHSDSPLRFGLAGYGAWGTMYARAFGEITEAQLNAVFCHSETSAQAVRRDLPNVEVFTDYQRFLSEAAIDVVAVLVPNALHAEFSVQALAAGKHLFLEKPLANTVADCDRVITSAQAAGKVVTLNHELRVSHQWGRIKELIDAGEIGRVCYGNFNLFRHPFRRGSGGWRYNPDLVGSWILEEPVHFFDLLMWYFACLGDPVRVSASGNGSAAESGLYQNFSATLHYPDGAYFNITQSLGGFGHHTMLELVGEEGAIRTWWSGSMDRTFDPDFELKILRRGASEPELLEIPRSGEVFELEEMLRRSVAGFRNGISIVTAEEARKTVIVCLQAERACQSREAVSLVF